MADDYGILVRADISEITADVIATIEMELAAIVDRFGVTVTHNDTFSDNGNNNL